MTPEQTDKAMLFIGDFSAHTEAYVENSRWHRADTLTPKVLHEALLGGVSISGYLARASEKGEGFETHIGAVDFDNIEGLNDAKVLRGFFGEHGFDSLLVESRRGAHLWVQCDHVIPAGVMRRALENSLKLLFDEDSKREVFPKRSSSLFGAGALRMPMMCHPKTGVRDPVHDPFDDHPVASMTELLFLMADIGVPKRTLEALAGTDDAKPSYPRFDENMSTTSNIDDAPRVTDTLSTLGVTTQPGRSVRCPLHDDAKASLQVAPDDMRAWCKSPSCVAYNDGRGLGSFEFAKHIGKDSPYAARSDRDTSWVSCLVL